MNGKGSKRRPREVSREQYAENWDATFSKPELTLCQACGKPPAECRCITLDELAAMMGMGKVSRGTREYDPHYRRSDNLTKRQQEQIAEHGERNRNRKTMS